MHEAVCARRAHLLVVPRPAGIVATQVEYAANGALVDDRHKDAPGGASTIVVASTSSTLLAINEGSPVGANVLRALTATGG